MRAVSLQKNETKALGSFTGRLVAIREIIKRSRKTSQAHEKLAKRTTQGEAAGVAFTSCHTKCRNSEEKVLGKGVLNKKLRGLSSGWVREGV